MTASNFDLFFTSLINKNFYPLFLTLVALSFLIFTIVYNLRNVQNHVLKTIFSNKIDNKFLEIHQTGGIALLIITILFFCSLLFFGFVEFLNVSPVLNRYILFWSLGLIVVSSYGFIDDKYNLSAIKKLASQLIAVSIIMMSFPIIDQSLVISILIFIFFFGCFLAHLNGTNLIDGVDTQLYKIGILSLFYYSIVLFNLTSDGAHFLPLLFIAMTIGFFKYNKSPARLYFGELGAVILAFLQILLATITFSIALYQDDLSLINSISLAILPLTYTVSESAISFLRRALKKQHPFRGDHLHLHHLLTIQHRMSAKIATNCLSGVWVFIIILGVLLLNFIDPFYVLVLSFIGLNTIAVSIGLPHWKKSTAFSSR